MYDVCGILRCNGHGVTTHLYASYISRAFYCVCERRNDVLSNHPPFIIVQRAKILQYDVQNTRTHTHTHVRAHYVCTYIYITSKYNGESESKLCTATRAERVVSHRKEIVLVSKIIRNQVLHMYMSECGVC
jgi:hypothetical protein